METFVKVTDANFDGVVTSERPVIIDFSQAVDAVTHPAARELLRRDVERTAEYFRRQGVAVDLDAALALVGDSPARFAHQVLSS